jgi:hypothetical protein
MMRRRQSARAHADRSDGRWPPKQKGLTVLKHDQRGVEFWIMLG